MVMVIFTGRGVCAHVCVWGGGVRTEPRDLCIPGKCPNIELQP